MYAVRVFEVSGDLPGKRGLNIGMWLLLVLVMSLGVGCLETEQIASADGDTDVLESENEQDDLCLNADCPSHSVCDPASGNCECEIGFEPLGGGCVALAVDGDTNESESEMEGESPESNDTLEDGDLDVDMDNGETGSDDEFEEGELPSSVYCAMPQTVTLSVIHSDAILHFATRDSGQLQTKVFFEKQSGASAEWQNDDSMVLDQLGHAIVYARLLGVDCEPAPFVFEYDVRDNYPPEAGVEGSTAIAKDDDRIVGWATGVASISFGDEVFEAWRDSTRALGPAEGTAIDAVSLGRGGSIIVSFDRAIRDGEGYDFAVFENSFSDDFLELAFVEISTDGEIFLRYDNTYLGETPLAAFDTHDTRLIGSLAGKYRQGFGTPFDLSVFVNRPEVTSGLVDLGNIRFVRVVDIVGDGSSVDSFGNVIYDPYPTIESAGFDLDAVGVLNH
jgi:hypothetical protein